MKSIWAISWLVCLFPLNSPQDPDDKLKETFKLNDLTVLGYVARDPNAAKSRFRFVVKPVAGKGFAYRVDAHPLDSDRIRLTVWALASEPARVGAKVVPAKEATYSAARKLIEIAQAGDEDWETHKKSNLAALVGKPEEANRNWEEVATALERSRRKYPNHLGLLRELIVAYTYLMSFERNTTLGTNLASLIPKRIAEYELRAGTLTKSELRTFRRAMANLYFNLELYPLAIARIEEDREDTDLRTLWKMMDAIGQAEFENARTFEVAGELASYQVTATRAKREPPDPKMLFHEWFFLPRLKSRPQVPSVVWYTLSRLTMTEKPRYYLYGFTENTHKVLMLYGTNKPTYDDVKKKVQELMVDALRKPKKKE